jgi:tRNA pseudouridine13 synthase
MLVIGDIVKKHSALYQEKTQEEDCDDLQDEDNTHDNVNNSNNNTNDIFNNNFEYINEDNIMKFNFDDLVMPIVGYEIRYPQNKVKDYIEMLLKEDGLSFKDFEYQSVNFNACGYFRKVIEKPLNDMKIEIVHHDNPDEDIQNEYYNIEPHPQLKGTKYTSARLVFQLPQSTYATMLFREITKHSSAGNYQANLSLNIK